MLLLANITSQSSGVLWCDRIIYVLNIFALFTFHVAIFVGTLWPFSEGCNFFSLSLDKDVTAGKAQMLIKYKGMVLHDYEYDLCEEVADLENPLYCPFKKGNMT